MQDPYRLLLRKGNECFCCFSQRYATHMMASDMSGLLAPPSRSGALYRAHTDPTSSNSNYECNQQKTPNSPPPTYEEVMKQVH